MSNPVVVTHAASNITDISALLNGELTDMGGYNELDALFYFREYGMQGWWALPSQTLTEPGHYNMSTEHSHDLTENTTYEFIALLASDGSLVAQGSILTFTTLEGFTHPDSPITHPATDIEETKATLNGEVTNMGDANEVQALFWYQKDGMGSSWWATSPSQTVTYPVTYSHTLTGLDPDTVYNFFARIEYYDNDGGGWARHGSIMSFTTTTPYQYTYGSGTEEDPYQVWTPDDLDGVREHLHSYFIQKADIDLSGYDPWTPISTFTGSYDGGNFSIKNLKVNVVQYGDKEKAGLFGHTNEAKLININADVDIYGAKHIGGLVGIAIGGSIENCHTSGKAIGQEYVGGMIGRSEGVDIIDSSSSCDITGEHVSDEYITTMYFQDGWGRIFEAECESIYCGGLIGIGTDTHEDERGVIERSYATGSIKCGDSEAEKDDYYGAYVGGFAGTLYYYTLNECYATGNVQASFGVGGFSGLTEVVEISDCFARGEVAPHRDMNITLTDDDGNTMLCNRAMGGFIGRCQQDTQELGDPYYVNHCYSTGFVFTMSSATNQSGGFTWNPTSDVSYLNNYYDKDTAQQNDTTLAYPRTTAQMVYPYTDKHVSGTYVDWEFEEKHITDLTDFDFVFGEPPIWGHDYIASANDGYPYLLWQDPVMLQSKCIPFLFKVPYWG